MITQEILLRLISVLERMESKLPEQKIKPAPRKREKISKQERQYRMSRYLRTGKTKYLRTGKINGKHI